MNTNLYNQLCQEGIHPEWAANAASVHQMIQEKKPVPIFMLQKPKKILILQLILFNIESANCLHDIREYKHIY